MCGHVAWYCWKYLMHARSGERHWKDVRGHWALQPNPPVFSTACRDRHAINRVFNTKRARACDRPCARACLLRACLLACSAAWRMNERPSERETERVRNRASTITTTTTTTTRIIIKHGERYRDNRFVSCPRKRRHDDIPRMNVIKTIHQA
jgi:hypothetical protein